MFRFLNSKTSEIGSFPRIDTTDGWHHKLLEITENLHREDLTAQERAKLTSIWVEHVKPGQLGPVSGGRGNKDGLNDAARQLGINRKEIQRAVKIAGLSQEAQDAAVELGLDDNQDALLEAAKYDDPVDQVDALKERAAKPKRKKKGPLTPAQTTDKIIKLLKSIRADRLALTEILVVVQSMLKE